MLLTDVAIHRHGSRTRRQHLAAICHRFGLLSLAGRLRRLLSSDLRILAYHRVLDSIRPPGFEFDEELISANAASFREQMQLLRRKFQPIRFDELIRCIHAGQRPPPRAVLVTFDDGYDDNYRVAFPILRELGVPAMFFVSTGHIDSGLPYLYDWLVYMVRRSKADRVVIAEAGIDWPLPAAPMARGQLAGRLLQRLKQLPALRQEAIIAALEQQWDMPRRPHPDCMPMSWDQLREMQQGGMEIGSHGVNHRMLARLPKAEMERELHQSRRVLVRELGRPAAVLSYPVGTDDAFSDTVLQATREAGFDLACSYVSGMNHARPRDRHALRRLHIERDVDRSWFRGILELPELFSYRNGRSIG